MDITRDLLDHVIELSKQAGAAILEVYNRESGFDSETKADNSPVTEADLAAHQILYPALKAIDAKVPVISEEFELPSYEERAGWHEYWLIDPLDGTKEFLKHNDEFTVNVALIRDGVPVLGVVLVPVSGIIYAGSNDLGAYRIEDGYISPISVRSIDTAQVEVVVSRTHHSEAVDRCIKRLEKTFDGVEQVSLGSSLKMCLIAEGKADFYPRFTPTSEWDTAAAHAIVEAAGGIIIDEDLKELRYNQKAGILNPYFYVIGDTDFDWSKVLA